MSGLKTSKAVGTLACLAVAMLAACGGGGGGATEAAAPAAPAATTTDTTASATTPTGTTTTGTTTTDTSTAGTTTTGTTTTDTTTTGTTTTPTPAVPQIAVIAATETAPGVFLVNPAATWKPYKNTIDSNAGAVVFIDLVRLLPAGTAVAGQVFEVQVLGTYKQNGSVRSFDLLDTDVSAVFTDSNGATVALSADSTMRAATQSECGVRTDATDPFVGDFLVPVTTSGRVTVPAGAVHLRLSVDDCFFNDNVPYTDPLRLSIRHIASN